MHMSAFELAGSVFTTAHERAASAGNAATRSRATVGRLALRFEMGERFGAIAEAIKEEIEKLHELEHPIGLAEATEKRRRWRATSARQRRPIGSSRKQSSTRG
jgi:hypothetical protein